MLPLKEGPDDCRVEPLVHDADADDEHDGGHGEGELADAQQQPEAVREQAPRVDALQLTSVVQLASLSGGTSVLHYMCYY